jgi:hypothetical protein
MLKPIFVFVAASLDKKMSEARLHDNGRNVITGDPEEPLYGYVCPFLFSSDLRKFATSMRSQGESTQAAPF